jgi:hypothetical protein
MDCDFCDACCDVRLGGDEKDDGEGCGPFAIGASE